ncbi:hypothetical protein EPR50_G00206590 [Perca flavescens]|uniref:Uncharacterized protein n=1 Tax=Perca flavescens TaxID=8167 RepID=A0A484CBD8_PERFV|nr:hypothetical protein EPR50_G00206590 [Perca flavescens]
MEGLCVSSQANVSSAADQLCCFDLATVFPAVPAPLRSPSSPICVQRESCLPTISQFSPELVYSDGSVCLPLIISPRPGNWWNS